MNAPGIEKHISGVIMHDETAHDKTSNGMTFPELLISRGIVPGIKVDMGLYNMDGTNDEVSTAGLDGLGQRCAEYYQMGCRFAKWRNVLKIANGLPT